MSATGRENHPDPLEGRLHAEESTNSEEWETQQLTIIESIVSDRDSLTKPECEYIAKILRQILSRRQIRNRCGFEQGQGDRIQLDLLGDVQS